MLQKAVSTYSFHARSLIKLVSFQKYVSLLRFSSVSKKPYFEPDLFLPLLCNTCKLQMIMVEVAYYLYGSLDFGN